MSEHTYKKMIKSKAWEFAFNLLSLKKENYRKLEKLQYYELRTKEYLLSNQLTFEDKRMIFKFRTRMSNFGENFRAGKTEILCLLCSEHLIYQAASFTEIWSQYKVKYL